MYMYDMLRKIGFLTENTYGTIHMRYVLNRDVKEIAKIGHVMYCDSSESEVAKSMRLGRAVRSNHDKKDPGFRRKHLG